MSIEVRQIHKSYGTFHAVKDVSLHIPTGELVALLGPSGSGKTTLLRLIAGLESVDSGQIFFSGEETTIRSIQERQVGFVFQHYALFRHMNVFENVAFGLRVRPRKERPSKKEIHNRVHDLLKLVQLDTLAERYPNQLSGGQRQRVALARALAVEPTVLLLDEPFGALDAKVRVELRQWLKELQRKLQITTVFVTHDQEEALEVADRVVIMNEGCLEQVGTPEEVYARPTNPFVNCFLGRVNIFHGRNHQGKVRVGDVNLAISEQGTSAEVQAVGFVRPHEIEVSRKRTEKTPVISLVQHIYFVGPFVRMKLKRADTEETFEVELAWERFLSLEPKEGETLYVNLQKMNVFLHEQGDFIPVYQEKEEWDYH